MNTRIAIKVDYRDYSAYLPDAIVKHIADELKRSNRYKFNKDETKNFKDIADIVSSAIAYFDMLASKPIIVDPADLRKNLTDILHDFMSAYQKLQKNDHKDAVELIIAVLKKVINVPDNEMILLTSLNRDEFYPMFVDLFNNLRYVFNLEKIREAQNYTHNYREQVREMLNDEWQKQYLARLNFEDAIAKTIEDTDKKGRYTPSNNIPKDLRKDLGRIIEDQKDHRGRINSDTNTIREVLSRLDMQLPEKPREATNNDADRIISRIARDDIDPNDLFVRDDNEGKVITYLGKAGREILQELNTKRREGTTTIGKFDYDVDLAVEKFVAKNESRLLGRVLAYPDEEAMNNAINSTIDDFVREMESAYYNQMGVDPPDNLINEWRHKYREFIEINSDIQDSEEIRKVESSIYEQGVSDNDLELAEKRVNEVKSSAQTFVRESQSVVQELNKQINVFDKMLNYRADAENSVDDYVKLSKSKTKSINYKSIKSTTYDYNTWRDMPLPTGNNDDDRKWYRDKMLEARRDMDEKLEEALALEEVYDPVYAGRYIKPLGRPEVYIPELSPDEKYEGVPLGAGSFRKYDEESNEPEDLYNKANRRWRAYHNMLEKYLDFIYSGKADVGFFEKLEPLARLALTNLHLFYDATSSVLNTVSSDVRKYVDALGDIQDVDKSQIETDLNMGDADTQFDVPPSYTGLYNNMVGYLSDLNNFIRLGNFSNPDNFQLDESTRELLDAYLIDDKDDAMTALSQLSQGAQAMQQGIEITIDKLENQMDVAKDILATRISKESLLPENIDRNEFLDFLNKNGLFDSTSFDADAVLGSYVSSVTGEESAVSLFSGKSFILRNLSYKVRNRVKVYA